MAVSISKGGGIYISINGDYGQFRKDMAEVKRLATASSKDISDAMSGALSPRVATGTIENLSRSLERAKRNAQAAKADLSAFEGQFRAIGKQIGVAEKDLGKFADMQTRALHTKAQRDFERGIRDIQKALGLTNKEAQELAQSMGGALNKAAKPTRELALDMGKLYVEAAKVASLKAVWDGFRAAFDNAARYETLGVVVQQVGRLAGYSAVEIDKNVNALRRMGIAGIEARKTMTQLLQAQVDIAKTPALARIAQDAAVIGGINSSEAFEKMVHGIQSASVLVLRNIGISVDFEAAYAKMAASIGKTTSELTEQEKVQARTNAVMESGERIAGTYEAAMTTLGKQVGSLSRVQQDFLTDAGKLALDIAKATGGISFYSKALEGARVHFLNFRGEMAGISSKDLFAAFAEGGVEKLSELVEGMESAKEEAKRFEAQLAALSDKLGAIDTSFLSSQLASLKAQLDAGALSAETFRRSITELMAVARATATQAAENAPAKMFVFKPYVAGSGVDPDIREIDKTMESLRASYNKTTEGAKQAKLKVLNENKDLISALVAQGHIGKEEAAKLSKAFQAEYDKALKSGSGGASGIKATETALSSLISKVEALKAQLAENKGQGFLVGLEKELHRYEQAAAKASSTTREQFNVALAEARELGKQIVSEQNLDIQNQFWTEFARMTGQGWDEYTAASERALEKQAEIFRNAGIEQIDIEKWIAAQRLELARTTQLEIQMLAAQARLEGGEGDFADGLLASLGKITEGYKNIATGLAEVWGDFFSSFTQGFANSIGQAIVYSEDLGSALRNVGQSAISSLISGLVQLGIQWAVSAALGQGIAAASSAAAVATATATGSAIAAAFAAAATAVSLATLGSNSAAAISGMAAAKAAGISMFAIPGFDSGGYTGNRRPDEVAGAVHGQEFVFSAPAVKRIGLANLEALHSGSRSLQSGARGLASQISGGLGGSSFSMPDVGASLAALLDGMTAKIGAAAFDLSDSLRTGGGSSFGGGTSDAAPFRLVIENTGTPQTYEVEYVTADEARIIARDEARSVVRSDSPGIVRTTFSGDMAQPNSVIAKSMSRNIKSERRR